MATPDFPHPQRPDVAAWWEAHNRDCRRELKRRGIGPDDPRHLEECRCNWPFVRFDQAQAAIAEAQS